MSEYRSGIEEDWPDPDRRDAGLERLLLACNGVRYQNGLHYKKMNMKEEFSLSKREIEVLYCYSHGMQWRETAEHLGISPYTVQKTMNHACRKLAAKTAAHAVAIAFRLEIIK